MKLLLQFMPKFELTHYPNFLKSRKRFWVRAGNGLRALRSQETRIKSSDELLSDKPMEILYMDNTYS